MEVLKNEWVKIPLLLYITGFVVHNVYLAKYGSYEFELVQAKYILSGFAAVAFGTICFAFISIKVNLSYVFDSLQTDIVLPWLLRVISLPYVVYSILYIDSWPHLLISDGRDPLIIMTYLMSTIASMVVTFTIIDLVFMYSEGEKTSAKLIRSVFRILAIPMVIGTIIFASNNSEFSSVVHASCYFFFLLLGLGLYQEDRRDGVDLAYLDSSAKEEHQDLFAIFFGIIAIAFILWVITNNYVSAIYPKIPAGLGGAKIEYVEIHSKGSIQKAQLIQETDKWILYINPDTNQTEKLKSGEITKIVYLK